ncbi:MAG TPA: response regulator [Anaerolineales bacterium]|nr:response regulator [Anaerolineales bacterium]
MADRKLARYLAQADQAYRKNNRQKGAQLVDKILQEDFNHRGAWELLYRLYGVDQNFEGFRFTFAQKHYPKRIHLLQKFPETSTSAPEKKPSFISRLFAIIKGKQKSPPSATFEQQPLTVYEKGLSGSELNFDSNLTTPAPLASPTVTPVRTGLLRETQNLEMKPQGEASPLSKTSSSKTSAAAFSQSKQPLSGGKYRVLVVDDISETRENIIRSLSFNDSIEVVGTAANGYQAIELAKKLKPEVVIMDVNMPDMDGIHATATIRREVPSAQVIILTIQDDLDYMRNAMLAGARDFLTKPPMIDELSAAVTRAGIYSRQELEKTSQIEADKQGDTPFSTRNQGKIISIYSPRGGIGCTTITANLAAVLHNQDTPVVIIDGNLQFGDIPVVFNAQSNRSFADLIPRLDEINAALVNEVLIHHSSGIDILASTSPEEADMVNGEQFQRLIQFFSNLYSYVLIDCPTQLTDTTLAALENSDLAIVLISQDIPSIARAKKFLDLAPLIHLESKRVLVAVNKYDKRIEITPEKLSATLKKEISTVIPLNSETVIKSINRGIPFMLDKQILVQPLGRAILELVEAVRQQVSNLEQEAEQLKSKP